MSTTHTTHIQTRNKARNIANPADFKLLKLKRVANFRKRMAAMPERMKKLNKDTRKMYFVDVLLGEILNV